MKATLFALFVGLMMVGCGESPKPSEVADMNDTAPKKDAIETAVDWSKLQNRNGLWYLPNKETPFTGRAELFYENGQKEWETNWKDGKYDGLSITWYENGQKESEQNFKDGKLMFMSAKVWKPKGEKCPVTNIDEDGNGVWVWYNDDGTEESRFFYKDGEIVKD
jgi:antitoxin component YwqK of YwqJK toxin-antitoxin module